jgi:hypothetical protein
MWIVNYNRPCIKDDAGFMFYTGGYEMAKKVFILSVMLIAFIAVNHSDARRSIRGSGRMGTDVRKLSGIHGVDLDTFGDLKIEIGDKEELRVEAEDNLLEYFETRVDDGILKIDTRRNVSISTRRDVKFYLTVKKLEEIIISSSGDVEAPDVKAETFKIEVGSSGDLVMGDIYAKYVEIEIGSSGDVRIDDLHAENLEVDINSSGDLKISGGQVEQQEISVNSSGDFNGQNLKCEVARVRLNSSGDARVRVKDRLNARLSSSGSLYYLGNPAINQRSSSSGEVRRLGNWY